MSTTEKNYSVKELEQMLQEQKKKQAQQRERERKAYEQNRDNNINQIYSKAQALAGMLKEFKNMCHEVMDNQANKLQEYGEMRSNSKGGFSVVNSDDTVKITRRRDTRPTWDERSTKAIELIKDFLTSSVKKRDLKMFEILMSFLERNKAGDLEYARVYDLLKHEDKFDDPRWTEGLKLIKESFHSHFKGFGYEFKTKGADGKWQSLTLNFSSL